MSVGANRVGGGRGGSEGCFVFTSWPIEGFDFFWWQIITCI